MSPEVLATCRRQGGGQLAQRNGHTSRNARNNDYAVDDEGSPTRVYTRDHSSGEPEPGIRQTEADTQNTPNAKFSA
jgi:hypothetical protein